jgi:two-component system, LuxR family, sensor kinase FixL
MAPRAAQVEEVMPIRGETAARPNRHGRMQSPSRFLQLTEELSRKIADASYAELPDAASSALNSLLEFFDLDRCAILRVVDTSGNLRLRCKAQREGSEPLPEMLEAGSTFPWAFQQVALQRRPLALRDVSDLPADAACDQQSFRRWGTLSLLVLPMLANGTVDHIVTLATSRRRRRWPSYQVQRLHLLSERIVGALRRREQYELREATERFESLLTDLSSRFAGARWDQIDQQIDHSLKELLAFTGVDECGFFTVQPDQGCSTLMYLATHTQAMVKDATVQQSKLVPWLWHEVVELGHVKSFAALEELPEHAAQDRKHFASVPVKSAVFIPYVVEGVTRYLLAVIVNHGANRAWSPRFIDRVQVLGSVFASALNRKYAVRSQLQAAQDLAATRRLAQSTLDALNEYVCVVDGHGVVVEASDRWRSLGKDDPAAPENVPVGGNYVSTCATLQAPWRNAAEALAAGIRAVLAGRQEQFELEYSRAFPDGPRQLQTLVRRFPVDEGIHAAISHVDITERHRTQQELDELRLSQWHSDRVMRTGVLVASLAHELSQPLAAILSNSQAAVRFLAAGPVDPQELTDILNDIVEDDKRAARVIEALRRMLRRQEPERRPVDLCEVVRDMGQLLHSEFIRQHIQLDQECSRGSVAMVDRGQIQQVVLNLVMNAIEAMAEVPNAQRKLSTRVFLSVPGEVQLEISDSGPGFSDEQLASPFQAFWTTKRRGTGLGLAICSSIVSSHGGHIRMERNPEGGARVVVVLPAVRSEASQ